MKDSQEYKFAKYQSMQHFGANESTDKAFEAGFDFAMAQPKHLLDEEYPVHVGEVRRYMGSLYKAVEFIVYEDIEVGDCQNCAFHKSCFGLIPCENGLKFIEIKE